MSNMYFTDPCPCQSAIGKACLSTEMLSASWKYWDEGESAELGGERGTSVVPGERVTLFKRKKKKTKIDILFSFAKVI